MPDGGFPARVDSLLLELASQEATGCLTLTEPEGEQSSVWFRDGLIYAVSVPGRRPLLGVRLMSSGALTPEALAEALEVQRTELQGWRLGELLVHLSFVDRDVVESFVSEQLRDQVADLLEWDVVEKKFRNGKRTRQDVAPPIEVTDLLALARERDARWAEIVPFIGGADSVPVLSTATAAASDVVLGPYDWAMLCKVDGIRTIADLADDCGFTVFEAGMVVVGLVDAGLVDIDGLGAEDDLAEEWAEDDLSGDDLAASVAKVTAALTDMGLRAAAPYDAPPPEPGTAVPAPRRSPFSASTPAEQPLADVVSLDAERQAKNDAAREAAAREESARAAADKVARAEAEEAARLGAERLAVEEAARVEAERVAAEEAARVEAERIEAERVAAEEAARVEAERVAAEEAARVEAERVATEEAARLEAERVAAEEAARVDAERIEAERIAAEEAARVEAERVATEEAARLDAERIEAERVAAEEAARVEAERVAAEEAARLDAERIEAERVAAEEAARVEAERVATEEAARVDAEQIEAERVAAEEAARLDAERVAAEQAARIEAARIHAEQLNAAAVEEGTTREELERHQAELLAVGLAEPVPTLEGFDRHAGAALLTELALDPILPPVPEPSEESEPIATTYAIDADDEVPAYVGLEHSGVDHGVYEPALAGGPQRVEGADMAALMRELSSLGGGFDSDATPTGTPVVTRPVQTSSHDPKGSKKKKGFFGR